MVTSGLNQETIDKYRQVSKHVWVVDCLPCRLFCQWILSSESGCISSDPTSHHGTSMITLLPTSSCSGFYSHAPEVPRVLHERVIGRYILFRSTFSLMSYIRAVVSHCPISMCEKNVVAQTRTGVFLASLNIAGVGSSRYDIDIMAISWECALYNRRTRRSVYSAIITVAYVSAI